MRKSHAGIKRLLLFLFVPILGLSLLSNLFDSLNVSAASSVSLTTEQQAASITYYNVLRVCIYNYMNGDIPAVGIAGNDNTNADPSKVSWFNVLSGDTHWVVYNQAGGISCESVAALALPLWGFKVDGSDFLSKLGYTWQGTGAQASSPRYHRDPNGPDTLAKFESAVQSVSGAFPSLTIFKGDALLTGAAKYYAYKAGLDACQAKPLGLLSSLNSSQRDLVTNNKSVDTTSYIVVTLANGDGTTSQYGYSYRNSSNDGNAVIPLSFKIYGGSYNKTVADSAGGGGALSTDCTSALSIISDTAQAASTDGAASNCAKTYTDTRQIAACAGGASNTANIDYCAKSFQDKSAAYVGSQLSPAVDNATIRNACYSGQGNPGGDACYDAGGYTSSLVFTACLNGRANSTDPAYCKTTYPGVYSAGKFSDQANQVAACKYGQKLGPAAGLASSSKGPQCTLNPNATGCTQAGGGATSCVVDNLGWLVCPVMTALGGLSDAMYGWIEGILVLNPLSQTITDKTGTAVPSPQYSNWSNMRNIANVLLVIGFLAIIFSQITSIGISNYGVKKMLPRIVLVALAINLSWVIMSLSVDVVNIVGVGLHTLLSAAAADPSGQLSYAKTASDLNTGTGIAAGLAATGFVAIVATSSTFSVLVLMALPFILGAVLALLAAVATLFLRNALVVVLVIIAPVAIAASILPNTEQYFKSWRKLFLSMLFLFPMAALLFGGARFAAYVIVTSNQPMATIIALFVMAAPLGMLPWLARSAGGILSTVNSRLGSMAKGLQGAAQKGLAPRIDTLRAERKINERSFLGIRRRDGKTKGGREVTSEEAVMEHARKVKKDGTLGRKLYGQDGITPIMKQAVNPDGTPKTRKVKTIVEGKDRRRNWSQMLAQSGERLKTRSATAQETLATDTKERGLLKQPEPGQPMTFAQRQAAKTAAIYDRAKLAGLRTESVEAQYKGRLEVSKLVDGQTTEIYDRLQDAGTTTKALEEEQTLRQKDRIVNNAANTAGAAIGLSRLAQVNASAEGYISDASATRLQKLAVDSPKGGGGAGIKIQHENMEAAEQGVHTIDAQLAAELAERKEHGGDLFSDAAAEAKFKAIATASGKRFDATIKEFAGDKTAKELRKIQLGKRPATPQPGNYPGGENDPAYLAAIEAGKLYDTRSEQLADAEAMGLRKELQGAAKEDYVAGIRISQADNAKTLGIDKEMQEDTPEGRELLRRATGVGTEDRVRASAARRLEEDHRSDVTAQKDLYQRANLGRDDNFLLQGQTINGDMLFDSDGTFIYDGADKEEVWQNYVKARATIRKPLPPALASATTSSGSIQVPEDSRIDSVQEEALVRRTVEEGDQRANERLQGSLAEKLLDAEDKAKVAQNEAAADPDNLAKQEKAKKTAERVATVSKLQAAMMEQYRSNPGAIDPFSSSADRGDAAKGTLRRLGDEQIVNTFGSEKVAQPRFSEKWNIDHWKAAKKVWVDLAQDPSNPRSKIPPKIRSAVDARLAAMGVSPGDVDYVETFQKARMDMMIETNLEKDGTPKPGPTATAQEQREYDTEFEKKRQSIADSIKGLDTVESDTAYTDLDPRAKEQIAIIRQSMDTLRTHGALLPIKPDAGVTYRRRSYTQQPGVVETIPNPTTGDPAIPVYLKHDTTYPDDLTRTVRYTLGPIDPATGLERENIL